MIGESRGSSPAIVPFVISGVQDHREGSNRHRLCVIMKWEIGHGNIGWEIAVHFNEDRSYGFGGKADWEKSTRSGHIPPPAGGRG
jgi:hypothetical protein